MAVITFRAEPTVSYLPLITVTQAAESSGTPSCRDRSAGLRHYLYLRNESFGVRQRLEITYSVDSGCAAICFAGPREACGHSRPTLRKTFPGRQLYWRAAEKALAQDWCWSEEDPAPDLNLQIELTSTPFSTGTSEEELKDMRDSCVLVMYCKRA